MNVSNSKIFQTLNPSFIRDILKPRMTNRLTREEFKLNLEIPKSHQIRFGTKGLTYLGPKLWNSLSYHIKSLENLNIF